MNMNSSLLLSFGRWPLNVSVKRKSLYDERELHLNALICIDNKLTHNLVLGACILGIMSDNVLIRFPWWINKRCSTKLTSR